MKANNFIQDVDKMYYKKEITVIGENKKEYTVVVDKLFKRTKISKIVGEMMNRAEYCKINDVEFNFPVCQVAMIIKEFTDIQFATYKDIGRTYANELLVTEALADLGVLQQIVSCFEEKEIEKINKIFKEFGEFTKQMHNVEIDQKLDKILEE